MAAFKEIWCALWRDERGTTAIEYVLIASAVAMVLIASFGATGDGLQGLFSATSSEVSDALANSGSALN